MVNLIEKIIDLHKNSGEIKDAYIKIHMDEKTLNLNTFTLKVNKVNANKKDVDIWNEMINNEVKKNRKLEKEANEFETVFKLLNKLKIRSGHLKKTECPDFLLERKEKMIGIEVTRIYVGYDWIIEKLSNEIKKYKIDEEEIEGYIEYKKFSDKVEVYHNRKDVIISPKLQPQLDEEYNIIIKNKILEKIRKQIDNYNKYDVNIIFAEIISPEYFEDIADLDNFCKEISYYIAHLEGYLNLADYRLIIKINKKWVEINLNEGKYIVI